VNVEETLLKELNKAKQGQPIKPIRIKDGYAIAELIEFSSTELNEELKNIILNDQFNIWLEEETKKLLNTIKF
jgi:parvulin-like peptidyl-prolyl isomerase